ILLARFRRLGVVFEVIIPVGQSQSRLVGLRHNLRGIVQVLTRGESEQCSAEAGVRGRSQRKSDGVQVGNLFRQLRFVMQSVNSIQLRLERGNSLGVGS